MKLYRVINQHTGLFLRDDFYIKDNNEIALDVSPAQGLYQPRWNGTEWVEGATEIPTPQPTQPAQEEVIEDLIALLVESGVIGNV